MMATKIYFPDMIYLGCTVLALHVHCKKRTCIFINQIFVGNKKKCARHWRRLRWKVQQNEKK